MFKFICTVFLLFITVQKSGGENVQSDAKLPYIGFKYANNTEISLHISSKVEQLQLEEIRLQLNRQNELLNKLVGKLYEPIKFPSSCGNVTAVNRRSGIHQIVVPSFSRDPFNVSCDQETQGGGWTTVLRRQDGSVDFFRFWNDYKHGFGNPSGEFFIGLEKLHFMTKAVDQELLITMEHPNGKHAFAKYDRFAIDGENEAYKLSSLGNYSGGAGDDLRYHEGKKFTSRDNDNDNWSGGNCAKFHTDGWWYHRCHLSNLMGKYNETEYGKGINWYHFTGYEASLKRVEMMIRPRRD